MDSKYFKGIDRTTCDRIKEERPFFWVKSLIRGEGRVGWLTLEIGNVFLIFSISGNWRDCQTWVRVSIVCKEIESSGAFLISLSYSEIKYLSLIVKAVSLSLGRFRVFKGEFILSIVSHISPLIWNGWIRNPNQIFDLVEVSDLLSYLIDLNGDGTLMRKEKGEREFEIHPNRNLSPTPY